VEIPFLETWIVDFEYHPRPGEHMEPLSVSAYEWFTGRSINLWLADGKAPTSPPYSIGIDSLFVGFSVSGDLQNHIALGWELPVCVLDLHSEFVWRTSGLHGKEQRHRLVDAVQYFHLPEISIQEKDEMHNLAIEKRGDQFSPSEREALMKYCESDVRATTHLLRALLPTVQWPYALFRGRYTKCCAQMEWRGTPTDLSALTTLRVNWNGILADLIREADIYNLWEAGHFRQKRFTEWVDQQGLGQVWPRLESGKLSLDDEDFSHMSKLYEQVLPIRQLRHAQSNLRNIIDKLSVGSDGRNRTFLSPFSTKTNRSAPKANEFIFSPAAWLRPLIRPEQGSALAYVDISGAEIGIAAYLSGDVNLQRAYESSDPYVWLARFLGYVPEDATATTHPRERKIFKRLFLAVGYGMGGQSLAAYLGVGFHEARNLINLHHRTFEKYWDWSDGAEIRVMLHGHIQNSFGWILHSGPGASARTARNFPAQSNCGTILQIAVIAAIDAGLRLTATLHDAVLVEAGDERIEADAAAMQEFFARASELVLNGHRLRSDCEIIRWPGRFKDASGFWDRIWKLIENRSQTASISGQLGATNSDTFSVSTGRGL